MKHVREPLPDVQRAAAGDLGRAGRGGGARHRQGDAQPLRRRRRDGARPRAGAGDRGRARRRGHRRGHDRAARAARRHRRLRPRAAAPSAPGAAWSALLALALVAGVIAFARHAHARRAPGGPVTPRPPGADRGAAGQSAASDYDPGGRRRGVPRARPSSRSTATGPPAGTPRPTRAARGPATRPAWASTWTPATPVARPPARPGHLHARLPGARSTAANGVPARLDGWDEAERARSTVERGPALRPRHATDGATATTCVWITKLPERGKAGIQELSLKK